MPLPRRLALQVTGRTVIRDCCWHHRIDWHQASATAVGIVRRLRRERITDEDEMFDRAFDLALELDDDQGEAVRSLLTPGVGITVGRDDSNPRRWHYQEGRKRTYTMLEAGVHRTVVIDWVEVPPR